MTKKSDSVEEDEKKGRNVIKANVKRQVKVFFNERYSGVQSKILGNFAETFMLQVKDEPDLLHYVLSGEFRIVPRK